jgi:hypothetical protein
VRRSGSSRACGTISLCDGGLIASLAFESLPQALQFKNQRRALHSKGGAIGIARRVLGSLIIFGMHV